MDIDHVVLWVSDPMRALDFYEHVLGLRPANAFRAGKALFPSVRVSKSSILDLFPKSGAPIARIVAMETLPSGAGEPVNHLCFSMSPSEYDELRGRLRDARVTASVESHSQGGARGRCSRSIYFQDPDGNVLQAVCYG